MAQQTDTEWTDAQNAAELNAGDSVRVVNERTGSAVLDTATVRDALEGVGTVNVQTATGRTKEVRFQEDGSVKVRGDCFTYTLQVEREVATDGGQDERTQGEAVVAEAEVGDEVAVQDRERGRIHTEDSTGTYEVQERVNAHTLKVQRVDGSGHARMQAHASGEGVRVLTGDGSGPGVVWHEASLAGQDEGEAEGAVCLNCREWLDHFTPVNTGHATTGDSGCPHCLEAEGVRNVSHEVGDERTITGGYVPEASRGHGSQVTLDAARALTQE